MSEGILGKAIYRCNQCNVKHYLNNDDFDFQIESCDIRNMGEENQYVAEFSENCHQCNNEISLRFEIGYRQVRRICSGRSCDCVFNLSIKCKQTI